MFLVKYRICMQYLQAWPWITFLKICISHETLEQIDDKFNMFVNCNQFFGLFSRLIFLRKIKFIIFHIYSVSSQTVNITISVVTHNSNQLPCIAQELDFAVLLLLCVAT